MDESKSMAVSYTHLTKRNVACTCCKELKDYSGFHKLKNRKNGPYYNCKDFAQELYNYNRDKIL